MLCCTNNLYQDPPEDIGNGLLKIASCLKKWSNSTNVLICSILPCRDIFSVSCLFIKETNNILKSSCSINHINFIDQDRNWIQMSGSLEPDLFYLDKLHLVGNRNFILTKSIYISVKNGYGFQNKHQLNKVSKSVKAFSLNNVYFPTLTFLSPRELFSDCISVLSYKSVHNSFVKPVHKSYISSIKFH